MLQGKWKAFWRWRSNLWSSIRIMFRSLLFYYLPPSTKHSQVNMHADGTSHPFSSKNISKINEWVNEGLDCLKIWLAGNELSLNFAKANCLVIGSSRKMKDIQCLLALKPSFAINGEEISMIEHTKYYRVQVAQYLSWENHINQMIKRFQGS